MRILNWFCRRKSAPVAQATAEAPAPEPQIVYGPNVIRIPTSETDRFMIFMLHIRKHSVSEISAHTGFHEAGIKKAIESICGQCRAGRPA